MRCHPISRRGCCWVSPWGRAARGRVAEEAARLLTEVAAARPDHAHPCQDLATLLRVGGGSALPVFEAALRLPPEEPALVRAYAEALLADNRTGEAMGLLDATLALRPDHLSLRVLLGTAQGGGREDGGRHR